MFVKEMFEEEMIGKDFIEINFDLHDPYWKKSDSFLRDEWDSRLEHLTPKMHNWIRKILDDCVEKRLSR